MENYLTKLFINLNLIWVIGNNKKIANNAQPGKSVIAQTLDCFIRDKNYPVNCPNEPSLPMQKQIGNKFQDKKTTTNQYSPIVKSGNRRIKTIIVHPSSPFSDDLKKLSAIEGFNFEKLDNVNEWLEDYRILLSNGKFLLLNIPQNLPNDFLSLNKALLTDSGMQVFRSANKGYFKPEFKDKYLIGNSYIEGGNLLTIKKFNGEISCIVGIDSAIATQRIMEAEGKFDKDSVKKQIDTMEKSGVFNEELLLKTNKQFEAYLQAVEKYPKEIFKRDDFPSMDDRSKDFLAKVELAKLEIAKDLGMKPENLTFITQPDFHIDMDLRPIGDDKNSILLSSNTEVIKLINSILSDPKNQEQLDKVHREVIPQSGQPYIVEHKQRRYLKFLLDDTIETASFTDAKLKKVKQELQAAGYNVIDFPGKPGTGLDINYLNSIVGIGNKGKFYATGAVIQNQYGLYTEAIETILKNLGFNNVYFIGDPKKVAHTLWHASGGLDCATNEIAE